MSALCQKLTSAGLFNFGGILYFLFGLGGWSFGTIGVLARAFFSAWTTNARRAASAFFGLRARASFSARAANARNPAVVGVALRGARAAKAGSGKRVSTLAKRRCPLMSLPRPTMR